MAAERLLAGGLLGRRRWRRAGKPLYHALKRLYADRLLAFTERDGRLYVAAVNQARTPWAAELTLRRTDVEGRELAAHRIPVDVAPASVHLAEVPAAVAGTGDPGRELIVAEAAMLRAWRFGTEDRDFAYPGARMDIAAAPLSDGGGTEITVTARTLVRDLLVQADRLDPAAAADRGRVTLLPGESVAIRVAGFAGDVGDVLAARALWCVNGGAVDKGMVGDGVVGGDVAGQGMVGDGMIGEDVAGARETSALGTAAALTTTGHTAAGHTAAGETVPDRGMVG